MINKEEICVGIILVNYNSSEDTIECIQSIRKSNHRNTKIYVIDNGSSTAEVNKLKTIDVHQCILSKENHGFSGGNNIGIRLALADNCDYVMLLNNDTVIDKYMIQNLLNEAKENVVTVPKMFYYDHKNIICYAGGEIDMRKGIVNLYGENKIDNSEFNEIKCVNFASGCCMLINRDIFYKVGFLPEEYFMYYEDVDYSMKLSVHNVSIMFIPNSILWHKISKESRRTDFVEYYSNRNRFYFIKKYKLGKLPYIYSFVTRVLKSCLTLNKIYLKSYIDFRKNKMGIRDFDL